MPSPILTYSNGVVIDYCSETINLNGNVCPCIVGCNHVDAQVIACVEIHTCIVEGRNKASCRNGNRHCSSTRQKLSLWHTCCRSRILAHCDCHIGCARYGAGYEHPHTDERLLNAVECWKTRCVSCLVWIGCAKYHRAWPEPPILLPSRHLSKTSVEQSCRIHIR